MIKLLIILAVLATYEVIKYIRKRGAEKSASSPKEVKSDVIMLYPKQQRHTHTHTTRDTQMNTLREEYKRWAENNEEIQRLRSRLNY